MDDLMQHERSTLLTTPACGVLLGSLPKFSRKYPERRGAAESGPVERSQPVDEEQNHGPLSSQNLHGQRRGSTSGNPDSKSTTSANKSDTAWESPRVAISPCCVASARVRRPKMTL